MAGSIYKLRCIYSECYIFDISKLTPISHRFQNFVVAEFHDKEAKLSAQKLLVEKKAEALPVEMKNQQVERLKPVKLKEFYSAEVHVMVDRDSSTLIATPTADDADLNMRLKLTETYLMKAHTDCLMKRDRFVAHTPWRLFKGRRVQPYRLVRSSRISHLLD